MSKQRFEWLVVGIVPSLHALGGFHRAYSGANVTCLEEGVETLRPEVSSAAG